MQELTNKIKKTVDNTASDLMIDCAKPNTTLVNRVMQMDASELSELRGEELSGYILVMGQYLVMLQYQENLKNIDYMLAQKAYEYMYSKERFLLPDDIKFKTEKAYREYLMINSEILNDLNAVVLEAQAEKMLLENMTKACSELLNALKKEKSGRDGS